MEAQALQRYQTVAASNPNTPISYLRQFSKSENETTIFWVGENPSLPKDVIQVFVGNLISSDEHERCHLWGQIANNTSLGEDTIALLSKHKLYWVREKLLGTNQPLRSLALESALSLLTHGSLSSVVEKRLKAPLVKVLL
jgi:hypothetical protein